MKRKIYTFLMAFALVLSINAVNISDAFAASVSVSGAGASCTVGETVTVSFTYSSPDGIGAATANLSYDSGKLQFISSGGDVVMSNGNLFLAEKMGGNLTMTFTFKTLSVGSTSVSITTTDGSTFNTEESFTYGTVSTTVTAKEKTAASTPSAGSSNSSSTSSSGTSSSSSSSSSSSASSSGTSTAAKPNESTNGRGNAEPEEEVVEEEEVDLTAKPDTIEVVIGGKTYIIVENLKDKELPEDFEAKKIGYGEYEWKIHVAKSENSKYTLILLQDKDTSEESWWFFNEETGEFTNSTTLDVLETLEFEALKNAPEEEQSNAPLYALGTLSAALAGGLGYLVYRFKDELLPKK